MSLPPGCLDDAALERLFTRPQRFRQGEAARDGEEPGVWECGFEGHLIQVIRSEVESERSASRFAVYVDGEPAGELQDWPNLWHVG